MALFLSAGRQTQCGLVALALIGCLCVSHGCSGSARAASLQAYVLERAGMACSAPAIGRWAKYRFGDESSIVAMPVGPRYLTCDGELLPFHGASIQVMQAKEGDWGTVSDVDAEFMRSQIGYVFLSLGARLRLERLWSDWGNVWPSHSEFDDEIVQAELSRLIRCLSDQAISWERLCYLVGRLKGLAVALGASPTVVDLVGSAGLELERARSFDAARIREGCWARCVVMSEINSLWDNSTEQRPMWGRYCADYSMLEPAQLEVMLELWDSTIWTRSVSTRPGGGLEAVLLGARIRAVASRLVGEPLLGKEGFLAWCRRVR